MEVMKHVQNCSKAQFFGLTLAETLPWDDSGDIEESKAL